MTNYQSENSNKLPFWFRLLNLFFLLPILAWPLVLIVSFFLFTIPRSPMFTIPLFVFINAYPIYLYHLHKLNFKLFRTKRILAIVFPVVFILSAIVGLSQYLIGWDSTKEFLHLKERKTEIPDKFSLGFKKDKQYVYRRDGKIIEGADPKTFEIINYQLARDSKSYFFNGKRHPNIDYKTFQNFDYHYSKDKNNVYYDEDIVVGADSKTFEHTEDSIDGKDKNNCYRRGKKVDCSVLLKDE